MSQSASVAARDRAVQRAHALVAAQLDARVAQGGERAGQERAGDVGVDQQRLGRVADAGALGLGVDDDLARHVEVGGRVDVDVAVARRGEDHRDGRDLGERLLQPLAPARDDQVDQLVLGRQLGQLLTPAAGDEADRALGRVLGGDRGEDRVGVRGARRAPQHDRVARLQAQRGGVDRDVRPRLVDHRDDAERRPRLGDVQAVGQPEPVDDLADRIRQRGDVAHLRGDRGDPLGIQQQPVQQRVGEPRLAPGLQIPRVGLEDLDRPRLQRIGDRQQRGVLLGRRQHGQTARRGAGGTADVGHGGDGDGHAGRVTAGMSRICVGS